MSFSAQFTHAITRQPPASIVRGLRAANTIRCNDPVPIPAGFPPTRDAIAAAAFAMREIGKRECATLDGGMSCLSPGFTPS
ncbi:MAG: hypothetical protein ACK4TJ_03400 [Tabrizicola sp.]